MSGETPTYATYKEFCGNLDQPWVTLHSAAVDWTQQVTTRDQARIEAVLDTMAVTGVSILHVGVGNSDRRLGARPALRRSGQLVQKRSGLPEIDRVKAFGEPAVDLRQELAGFGALALLLPQPAQAQRRS